jgi:arginine/lysine/ornithine decarboxylase
MRLLHTLQQNQRIPFHMPGHKRNVALLGQAMPYSIDITEIDGFDTLQHPTGLLRELSERARLQWRSLRAYLSVNGSTGAILAGVRAMTKPGDTVLVARNCHMSVFHAIELCGLRPVLLEPEWLPVWGIYGCVAQETLDAAAAAHPEAALCVITSPTYEGVCSELKTDIPLLIDAAHGAHLPLPRADLVVMSLHKTLTALTQTAVLHVCSSRVDRALLEHQMRVFQTSSPSYVLLASIDECLALLEAKGDALFTQWNLRLDAFYARAQKWKRLRLFTEHHDRSKLLIDTGNGEAAAGFLRSCGLEPEYAREALLLLLTSPCDTDEAMAALAAALDELDAQPAPPAPDIPPVLPQEPCPTLPGARLIHATQSPGCVSAEYLWQYPPGIPLLLPGQVIARPPPGRAWVAVMGENTERGTKP